MASHAEDFSTAGTVAGFSLTRGSTALTATSGYGIFNTTSNANARDDFDLGSTDMFVEVDVTLPSGADRSMFVMLNCVNVSGTGTNAQNYYAVTGNRNNGTVAILKYVNGSATAVVASSAYSFPGDPFRVRFQNDAGKLTFFVNGTPVREWTETGTPITGTRGGLGVFNGGTVLRFDNYIAGSLGPPPGQFLIASF